MKVEVVSNSPLTYSMVGAVAVPRFTVWLMTLGPVVQLLVTVTWLAVPVETIRSPSGLVEDPLGYWQAMVLLRICVCGLLARFVRNVWITLGLSDESGAMVLSPVVVAELLWSLP